MGSTTLTEESFTEAINILGAKAERRHDDRKKHPRPGYALPEHKCLHTQLRYIKDKDAVECIDCGKMFNSYTEGESVPVWGRGITYYDEGVTYTDGTEAANVRYTRSGTTYAS